MSIKGVFFIRIEHNLKFMFNLNFFEEKEKRMLRIPALPIFGLLLIFFVVSCASSPPPKKEITQIPELTLREAESSKQVKVMNEKILMSTLLSKRGPYRDYKIGPEDLLEISVFEEEKLNKIVRVSSQGNISLPLLGTVGVKGLTANELEKEIRDLLAEKYFRDPHVSVFIKEYRSQRISVIGAVEKPGVFDVTGQKTVLDMLTMAGGLKEDGGQLLFLIRPPRMEDETVIEGEDSNDQRPKTFVIDLEELLVKGNLASNLLLIHGDVINIPLSGKFYVDGEVRSPGSFPIKGKKITVTQAITMAGGLTAKASSAETKIIRYSVSGKENGKDILSANVDSIKKGVEEDLYLQESDMVIVPKSGTKAFLTELWDFIKGRIGAVALGSL